MRHPKLRGIEATRQGISGSGGLSKRCVHTQATIRPIYAERTNRDKVCKRQDARLIERLAERLSPHCHKPAGALGPAPSVELSAGLNLESLNLVPRVVQHTKLAGHV